MILINYIFDIVCLSFNHTGWKLVPVIPACRTAVDVFTAISKILLLWKKIAIQGNVENGMQR